jgi:PII-like signaling protein/predicted transcriptional regulator
MHEQTTIQRVRIYVGERDSTAGQPLYLAVLERLRREGATGATALRGVAGFGPGHRLRSAGAADLDLSPPIVIEWVDRAERVARALPTLDDLLPNALITIEGVQIYRAVLRAAGPFGERSVGDVLERDVATIDLDLPPRAAAELLLERGQAVLPVLDDQQRIAGVLTGTDLVRRGGLALHPRLFGALAPTEQAALLGTLAGRSLIELMTAEPRTIYVEASIPQAIGLLVEWGLDVLPAADRAGRFAGIFGVEQALRAALEARAPADGHVRDADPPAAVHLVMQTAVPTIAASAPLAAALPQLLAAPAHFLVVVEDGRPTGVLDEALIAGQLREPLRDAWLALLRAPAAGLPPALEFTTDLRAGDIAAPAPTISALATEDQAIRALLDGGHERLVVVDQDGRLAGLLARRGMLRALAQESTA